MTIRQNDTHFEIEFPYRPYLVERVKGLPGSFWVQARKLWKVPVVHKDHVERFASTYGFTMGEVVEPETDFDIPALPELTVDIPLRMDLFPYQRNGVARALELKRLIIGDEPGLGKTGQSIAAIYHVKAFPCLVICPSSLKINWQREWSKWTDRKAMILDDKVKNTWYRYFEAGMADVFIVNYESLKKYFVKEINVPDGKKMRLNHITFNDNVKLLKSVIIDESHRCKSFATQQSKFVKGICANKEYLMALTGTPVINKPIDLMPQLGIIGRDDDFGGYKIFRDRYCGGPKEASNLKELNFRLNRTCFFRRDKKDVLKDLPAKMRQVVYCNIATRKEYADAEADLENYLMQYRNATDEQVQKSMKGEIMVRIGILKNISARGKLADVFEFIDDVMESGEKLVIFGHLKEVIRQIKQHYPGCVSITGDDRMDERQISVDSFQNNPNCKLIVCSIQAAGVGLTLTASSRVVFVELGWHPAIHDQCEDRCHRIGQTDSVQCTYFLGKDTIDEHIYRIIDDKRKMTDTITGTTNEVEVEVIDSILNLFSKPEGIARYSE